MIDSIGQSQAQFGEADRAQLVRTATRPELGEAVADDDGSYPLAYRLRVDYIACWYNDNPSAVAEAEFRDDRSHAPAPFDTEVMFRHVKRE